jgi:hypothetical protein
VPDTSELSDFVHPKTSKVIQHIYREDRAFSACLLAAGECGHRLIHECLPFVICMQEAEADDVEHLSCRICLGLCDRPVTAPCQHNFCLKCFRKWVNQEKTSCPTCRAALGKNLIHNPRINTMLASRIRQAQKVRDFLPAMSCITKCVLPESKSHSSRLDQPACPSCNRRIRRLSASWLALSCMPSLV